LLGRSPAWLDFEQFGVDLEEATKCVEPMGNSCLGAVRPGGARADADGSGSVQLSRAIAAPSLAHLPWGAIRAQILLVASGVRSYLRYRTLPQHNNDRTALYRAETTG
jgi:hypothetical protein